MKLVKILLLFALIYINPIHTPGAQAQDEEIQGEEPEDKKTPEITPDTQKGAWVIPKGKIYVEIYNKYYWHDSAFDENHDEVKWAYNGRYYEFRSELKLEYGLTDNLTILTYLPFKEASWKDDFKKPTRRNLVDVWCGAKYNLFTEPYVFTLQGRLKFPTHYNPNHVPSLGAEQIDGEIKFLFGKSLHALFNGYTKLEFGFRARDEEPTNEIPYFFELGYNALDWLTLKTTIDGIEGIQGTGKTEEDYTKYNVSAILKVLNSCNLEIGYGETFYGKNSSAAQEIVLSVSTQF